MVELNKKQEIEFFKMVARLSSNNAFEQKFGLKSNDVAAIKRKFDVESQEDARQVYKRLEAGLTTEFGEVEITEMNKAREAEKMANARLHELELERTRKLEENKVVFDANVIRKEDAERQKRFAASEEQNNKVKVDSWQLPLTSSKVERESAIERFRKDMQYQGMQFCINKYGATAAELKSEIDRLNIKIRWNSVKR